MRVATINTLEPENLNKFESLADLFAAIQREVDERFVELPTDVDGEVIRIGDEVQHIENRDEHGSVTIIAYSEDSIDVYVDYGRVEIDYEPMELRHYHKPTVEDTLREFAREFNRDDSELCDDEIIEAFAKRLRLADK